MAEALAPHAVLSKLEEKEKLRLTSRLEEIVAEREKVQKAMDEAGRHLKSLSKQRQQAFSRGVKAAELIVLNAAQQEQLVLKEALNERFAELLKDEKEVVRQMLVCDNKAKVYARMQQKHDDRQARRANRSEQQKLDDVMAHRRMRRS